MSKRMQVSLHIDHDRDVLSIGFSPASEALESDEQRRRAHLQAVRMQQLAPNIVAKYNSGGHLVGIDLFQAGELLDLDSRTGWSLSMHTAHTDAGAHSSVTRAGERFRGREGTDDRQGQRDGRQESSGQQGAAPALPKKPAAAGPPGSDQAARTGVSSWWMRLRAALTGQNLCPHCAHPYKTNELKFKRFLQRKEAEQLDEKQKLRSHFVYACWHCQGDIFDLEP